MNARPAAARAAALSLRAVNSAWSSAVAAQTSQLATASQSVAPLVLPQELRAHEMAALHAWCAALCAVCCVPLCTGMDKPLGWVGACSARASKQLAGMSGPRNGRTPQRCGFGDPNGCHRGDCGLNPVWWSFVSGLFKP
jgi:hypothetical protein